MPQRRKHCYPYRRIRQVSIVTKPDDKHLSNSQRQHIYVYTCYVSTTTPHTKHSAFLLYIIYIIIFYTYTNANTPIWSSRLSNIPCRDNTSDTDLSQSALSSHRAFLMKAPCCPRRLDLKIEEKIIRVLPLKVINE